MQRLKLSDDHTEISGQDHHPSDFIINLMEIKDHDKSSKRKAVKQENLKQLLHSRRASVGSSTGEAGRRCGKTVREARSSKGEVGRRSRKRVRDARSSASEEGRSCSRAGLALRTQARQAAGAGNGDPSWKYSVQVDIGGAEKTYVYLKCNFCDKVMKGGVTRMKEHLSGSHKNVAPCTNVPDKVKE
ncbi:hypothetical protein M5K25_018900 [Dendrobium thyrsiflorum]|uniref:BED-type domain-containing protein n=1 Tax=Dendrobium thyrsiflorum TaxID=117978 RepID=A0ABD0UKC8_DENTH